MSVLYVLRLFFVAQHIVYKFPHVLVKTVCIMGRIMYMSTRSALLMKLFRLVNVSFIKEYFVSYSFYQLYIKILLYKLSYVFLSRPNVYFFYHLISLYFKNAVDIKVFSVKWKLKKITNSRNSLKEIPKSIAEEMWFAMKDGIKNSKIANTGI